MYHDFDAIKAANPFNAVLSKLGLELKQVGNQWRGPCPTCKDGGDRALVVTEGKGWFCFAFKKGGDQIALVSHIKNVPVQEAAVWLSGSPKEKPEKPDGSSKTLTPLNYLEHDHDAVIALGFAPDEARQLGIGFAPRGLMKNTVAIPIRLPDGTLAGYIGIDNATLPPEWKGIEV